jgi:hypothetical protein
MYGYMMNWLKDFWLWFKSFFSEENGASTVRAMTWIWIISFCLWITFSLVFNAIETKKAELPPIDNTYVVLTSAFLGAKVTQRIWGENSSNNTDNTTTPIKPA